MPVPVAAMIERAEWVVTAQVGLRNEGGACGGGYLTEVEVDQALGEGPTGAILVWERFGNIPRLERGSDVLLFVGPPKEAAASCPDNAVLLHGMLTREEAEGWEGVLSATAGGRQPLPMAAARARLADPELAPDVLDWTLARWPGPLEAADVPVLVERMAADAAPEAVLERSAALLRAGPALAAADRDRLWTLVRSDRAGSAAVAEVLAAHEPTWLSEQLRATTLPAWVDIPAVNGLGVPQEALGRTWPVTTGDPEQLQDLGKFVRGEWDSERYIFDDPIGRLAGPVGSPNPWMPLLAAQLPGLDPEDREVAIGALRTLGHPVVVEGPRVAVGPAGAPALSLELELVMQEQERRAWLVYRIQQPITLCDVVSLSVHVEDAKHRVGGDQRQMMWGQTEEPAEGRVQLPNSGTCVPLEAGAVVRTPFGGIGDPFHALEGELAVFVEVVHDHRGAEVGLDAWTGRLAASASIPRGWIR